MAHTTNLDWIQNARLNTSLLTALDDVPSLDDALYAPSVNIDPPVSGQDSPSLINKVQAIPQSGKLTDAQKLDVNESSLLVDLAARGEVNPVDKPKDWYESYTSKLVQLGWKSQNLGGNSYNETRAEFKLSEVALKILEGLLGGPAATAAKAAINQLRQYDKDGVPGVKLFAKTSTAFGKSAVNIGYSRLNEEGRPEMAIAFFSVKMSREVTDFWLATLKTQETDLFVHSTTLTLTASYDDDTRKQVRDAIRQHRREGIKSWKLKPAK